MDFPGPTSGHLRVYRGRCSGSTRWFPSAGVIKKIDISERLGGESEGEGLHLHVKKLHELKL